VQDLPWSNFGATDAGAVHDFPVFAKQTGNELIATASEGDTLIFYLKRR
jgi:tRNA 2-thiouridine synthesizing protein A